MHTVKVTAVGDSLGIVLPPDVIERLHVIDGNELQLTDTAKGIELVPCGEELIHHLDVAKKVMEEDRDVLRKLAE